MNLSRIAVTALVAASVAASAHAAFIVEAHSSGLANATNFGYGGDTTTASASVSSAAVGLTATNSIFGGDGVNSPDTYVFSYTPGADIDNFSPAPGSLLGSTTGFGTETASGIPGGASGMYNVYWTTPPSTNISGGLTNFTLDSDSGSVMVSVDGNDGGTGVDLDPDAAFVGGANNAWYLLGTVELTAGTTYSVTQMATTNTFVSMRSHAVMWEAVPEPATCGLGMIGFLGLLGLVRRR